MTSRIARHWLLDPQIAMLNHGSFGACPREVLKVQDTLRRQMEAEPVRFLVRELEPLLDQSRQELATLVGASADDVVFVRNATAAVNSVLRSLRFEPGDELLVTDHSYNACRCAVDFVARQSGAAVVTASVPVPVSSPQAVIDAVLACVSERTRLAILDHVTSPTAVVFPIEELIAELSRRGVDTLVDGAHAPGMVPLDLTRLGAAYYAGNCHKWLCAPKGAGFLHVRADRQEDVYPTVISHGYNTRRPGRPVLHDRFDWTGTDDPTPWLCVGAAIGFLRNLLPGGTDALRCQNRELALAARRLLCERLVVEPTCSEAMIGSMAALLLPDDPDPASLDPNCHPTPVFRLQTELLERFGIEVPIFYWPKPPKRVLRVSAQAYNDFAQYERLAEKMTVPLRPG
jgi:isopenicillin-N epimerase